MPEILFHPTFKKDLKKIPIQAVKKIERLVDEVALNPLKCKCLYSELSKIRSCKIVANKVEYRVAYTFYEDKIIFLMARKRENFYDYLRRRIS